MEAKWEDEKKTARLKELVMQLTRKESTLGSFLAFPPSVFGSGKPSLNFPPPPEGSCNIAELGTGAILILGAEATAILLAGVVGIGISRVAGPQTGMVAFTETFEAVNPLFTPAFLGGAALMVDSGCIVDLKITLLQPDTWELDSQEWH